MQKELDAQLENAKRSTEAMMQLDKQREQLEAQAKAADRMMADFEKKRTSPVQHQPSLADAASGEEYNKIFDAEIAKFHPRFPDLFVKGSALNSAYEEELKKAEAEGAAFLKDPKNAATTLFYRAYFRLHPSAEFKIDGGR
jgi:hypothetical protein